MAAHVEGTEGKILDAIEAALRQHNISYKLKEKQVECLQGLILGKDILGVLPTGYGKTVVYALLPSVLDHFHGIGAKHKVLVISPLVSLMEDQVQRLNTMGIKAVQLNQQCKQDGDSVILLLSPEALFSGKWRDTLCDPMYQESIHSVVVDEAHCVVQWGKDFRQDFARVGELRSILPKATMVALTATATSKMQQEIKKILCMEKCELITTNLDRNNIFYQALKAPLLIADTFFWLVEELQCSKEKCQKYIIYCRSIKSCASLYKYFMDEMGSSAWIGAPGIRNALVTMYHHSTPLKNKRYIEKSFCDDKSTLRIVIATIAFGMGVDAPDIFMIIHWGASRTFEGFTQEAGRAGRNNQQSYSTVYYHPIDISATATDEAMTRYCKSKDVCRRKILLEYYGHTDEGQSDSHYCCDICRSACTCGQCPQHPGIIPDRVTDEELLSVVHAGERPFKEVSPENRNNIKTEILAYRHSLTEGLVSAIVLTGLTNMTISDIVHNVHYIHSEDDLLSEYLFDHGVASDIWQIIRNHTD